MFRVTCHRSRCTFSADYYPKPHSVKRCLGFVQKAVAGQVLQIKLVFLESRAPLIESETNVNYS